MPTLDATVGGASANSYLTRAAALAMIDDLPQGPFTAFLAADGPDQDRALIGGTQRLDLLVDWDPVRIGLLPYASTQLRLFPRIGTWNRAADDVLPSDVIPEFVELALLYQAAAEATSDRLAEPAARGIESADAGPLSVTFDKAVASQQRVLTDIAWKILGPWRLGGAALLTVPIARA